MTQPLTSFWPIFAAKSDGHDVVSQKGRPLRNGPTAAQLDRTPNAHGQCDYYRLIAPDDPKHVDWRKKLGGMLLRELGGRAHQDKWQQTILWAFPENYRLYEHIKTKADGHAKTPKNLKNHSGGGHDRQDAYLYGYPQGPRKRYRSPADFFPHLLWLCTDEASDYQNCTCKMCSPVQLDVDKPAAPPEPAAAHRSPPVALPPPAVSPPAPAALHPTPLPPPRGSEQLADRRYGQPMCRTGEVVWFFRPKTSAWGLGLVLRRWLAKDAPPSKAYLVQPLSHPFDAAAPELVTADQHLKPWLAWSAPSCTYPYLQQHPQLTYEHVDWNALLSGRYGEGVPDVDASIMAAKAIDTTYTLFERIKAVPAPSGEDRHYNGIYLGAEKIWRGDPVRIRLGVTGTDLLVITDIVERITTNSTQPQPGAQPTPSSQIYMTGDIYSYSTLPAPDPTHLPTSPSATDPNIPIRMREDMAWRNRTLVPTTQTLAYWRLIATASRIEMPDIKGRWYETSLLFEESFLKAVKNKEGGNGIWMNARGDAGGVGKCVGSMCSERVAAFGNAVPKGTVLVDGLEPPTSAGARGPVSEMQGLDLSGAAAQEHFSIDDFMNVEHLDDGDGVDFGGHFEF
ncbi:transcription-silencing protein Clr2-domain-containing protein [Ampelomyces quisqualis]|uniref:Transcription-silencing protein Clr2-domain-containing protein n=1 Tax=Ampelomyces quisqualis TaxID=50730 RepID=A0A6A5QVQ1_AMPQU|nr:transcription-silencing protein Clr2-domain-containing protein [Ampelomyces quisqualis]